MAEVFRLRICFSKVGRLRWLSHLELVRAMERLVRRSGLPYAVTQGFNRHMRFAGGPALPVGTAGEHELFDVWLTAYVPANDALAALQSAGEGSLAVLSVEYVPASEKGLQATYTVNAYVLLVFDAGVDAAGLQAALDAVVAAGQLEVSHKGGAKQFDLGYCVVGAVSVSVEEAEADGGAEGAGGDGGDEGALRVSCTLRNTAEGAMLRPEKLVEAALQGRGVVRSVVRVSLERDEA